MTTHLDWTNRADYTKATKSLDIDQWRWEFLRRTPEYREAWKRRGKTVQANAVDARLFDLPELINPNVSALTAARPIRFLRDEEGGQLHNIKCAIPDNDIDNHFFTTYMRAILNDKERAVYIINITKNIGEQIKRISESAVVLQDEYKNAIKTQLAKRGKSLPRRGANSEIPEIFTNKVAPKIDHLRVLDARLLKVPFSEIGQIIFRIKDADDAAIRASREYKHALIYWRLI